MDLSLLQVAAVFVVAFVATIDQFNFLQSLFQPIVTASVIGLILGDLGTGLVVGGSYQILTVGNMPVGGAQPPNSLVGGVVAAILACVLKLDPLAAVAFAIPFALLGQYAFAVWFKVASSLMQKIDTYASQVNDRGICAITYGPLILQGFIFSLFTVLFLLLVSHFGMTLIEVFPLWFLNALKVTGEMLRFVAFAVLLRAVVNNKLWNVFALGFVVALLLMFIPALTNVAMILVSVMGVGLAYVDYQKQMKLKVSVECAAQNELAEEEEDDEDGI